MTRKGTKMAKRHFLQQSHKYSVGKHKLAGKFLSEKLDGQRCFWDGGVSRGLPKKEVPWANNAGDGRYLTPPVATGLWSRYGNVIHAPTWFLNSLPPFPVDGELWVGRGLHQECRKIISPLVPDEVAWMRVKFVVFDAPSYESIFYDSVIDIPNYYKELRGCLPWIKERVKGIDTINAPVGDYLSTMTWLHRSLVETDNLKLLDQLILPGNEKDARVVYERELSETMSLGGEGLVTRDPYALYIPERVHHCVKHKPYNDAEGVVVGYVTGRETDKGSKLLGLMGAMIVKWKGKTFQLSGFTDVERTLRANTGEYAYERDAINAATDWASDNPEQICPDEIEAKYFPRGSKVTFKYRELTDDGIPKEAAYMRGYNPM